MILDAYRKDDATYRVDSQDERKDGLEGCSAWVVQRVDTMHVPYWWCCRHRSASCVDVDAVRNLRRALGIERPMTSDEEG